MSSVLIGYVLPFSLQVHGANAATMCSMKLSDAKTMTVQLIGKDDSSFDDSEVLTGRWQAYIDAYVGVSYLSGKKSQEYTDLASRAMVPKAYPKAVSSDHTYGGKFRIYIVHLGVS